MTIKTIESVTTTGYFGLVKIDLSAYWADQYAPPQLNPDSYTEYRSMREYLTGTQHRFGWHNTGVYLPDYVYVEPDAAVVFKLKYSI